jgi:hypothetical protein
MSINDKYGKEINPGDKVLIRNSRGDVNRMTDAIDCDGVLRLVGKDGLMSTAKNYLDAIYWANDEPENWLEVICDD